MYYSKSKKDDFIVHNIKFNSLYDLYEYLISNPEVNDRVFRNQYSLNPNKDFYGEPLNKAIEYLKGGYRENYDNFLKMNTEFNNYNIYEEEIIKTRSVYGGVPLAPLVAAGVPDSMLSYKRNIEPKVVNIYYNLSYPNSTSQSQIYNRGIITLYIIKTLESMGYIVNFYTFFLSSISDEIVNIEVKLKSNNDLILNIEHCYFAMIAKEFLRRCIFRVLESVPVTYGLWGRDYGHTLSAEDIKKFYNTNKFDLIIGRPKELNIFGKDIYIDTENMIKALSLEEIFELNKKKLLKK